MNSISILEAVNTSSVQFHGQAIITAMAAGVAYVAMRPIVENLGMSWSTQVRKLTNQQEKFNCAHMSMVGGERSAHMNTPLNRGIQKMLCIPLKKLNGWLFSINPSKVRADIRDKLIAYQEECFTVLHDYWTKGSAVRKPATTVDDRTPLRDAVNMLVSKKHLMYPEAYSIIHQRFAVDSIEDLAPEQITQAIEYVHRVVLDGEYLGKQMELQTPSRQFTDEELCHLCWLWKYSARMVELIADITPLLRVAEHRLLGAYAGAAHEYPMHINKVRRILDRETAHIECSQFRSDNWRILRQLRVELSAIR